MAFPPGDGPAAQIDQPAGKAGLPAVPRRVQSLVGGSRRVRPAKRGSAPSVVSCLLARSYVYVRRAGPPARFPAPQRRARNPVEAQRINGAEGRKMSVDR